MDKSKKRLIGGGVIAGSLMIGTAALVIAAGVAKADVISRDGDDSYYATCRVWADNTDGTLRTDTAIAAGVMEAIAQHYSITELSAAKVENYQVYTYCPQYWPNLVRVGNAARNGASTAYTIVSYAQRGGGHGGGGHGGK